ncbi:MAG TPA: bile acid:sodium symporter family protein [Rhizomicrobium sp.]|nr:bile acid:sodium symporter family protein [Rhizomicrobium sp.]
MIKIRFLPTRIPFDPYLLALLAMVGLGLVLPASGYSRHLVDGLAYAAISGLFFLYGARLAPSAIWAGMANWRLQSLIFTSTFLLFPLMGLAVGCVVRPYLPPALVTGLVFLTLLPSTVQSSIAFTSIARGDVPAALSSASFSNLAGVILTPILASFVFPGRHSLSGGSLEDIGLQIFLPFALGQAARPLIGAWLERHRLVTNIFDRGSILVIVYSAFSAGSAAGVWHLVSPAGLGAVLALDLVMLGGIIMAMLFVSRRLGFSSNEEIAIVFCGSKKSIASGLPMANILFPGHAVGLIVLPLMIFHQVQLFVCAALARRYAARAQDRAINPSNGHSGDNPSVLKRLTIPDLGNCFPVVRRREFRGNPLI